MKTHISLSIILAVSSATVIYSIFNARSGIFIGCYVTDAPSSQATLIALRKEIMKYGIPQNIYVDNGGEFLTFDVAVRRNVMTGLSQTTGQICLGYAQELGWDLEELDAKNIEFPDGSMHTLYEAEQYQRALERKIRETKRILAAQDEFFNNTSSESMKKAIKNNFDDFSIKLKRQEAQMNVFCEKTRLLVDNARVQKYGFGRSTAQKAVSSANKHYKTWSSEHNINNIKTLAEYYNVKYNDTARYELLKKYVSSVDTGMLSPLTCFDKYEEYYNRVQTELVGLTTSANIEIKSQSKHFLERVFGTKNDPKHENRTRNGVPLDDIKDALINGKTKSTHNGNSILHYTDKCGVTVNPHDGNLIQVNLK
ncbi:MAG: phage minor capsid protein [Ruminococcus sp.]